MTIHIGDTPQGERVDIPLGHTGVFGASGVGKTKLLKYLIKQAVDEQRIPPGTLTLGTDNGSAFTARSTRLAISALDRFGSRSRGKDCAQRSRPGLAMKNTGAADRSLPQRADQRGVQQRGCGKRRAKAGESQLRQQGVTRSCSSRSRSSCRPSRC